LRTADKFPGMRVVATPGGQEVLTPVRTSTQPARLPAPNTATQIPSAFRFTPSAPLSFIPPGVTASQSTNPTPPQVGGGGGGGGPLAPIDNSPPVTTGGGGGGGMTTLVTTVKAIPWWIWAILAYGAYRLYRAEYKPERAHAPSAQENG
jgi:hypothetical protein